MVARRYEQDITEKVKQKLISETYRQAVKDQKLTVVGYPDIEEIQFAKGQALQFAATIETAPNFEIPEYRGLPAAASVEQAIVLAQLLILKDLERRAPRLPDRPDPGEPEIRPAA